MWVVTSAINAYDQEGEYFIAVFDNKPTINEIKSLKLNVDPEYLLNGGGRISSEYEWFFLTKVKSGTKFSQRVL